jgi:hypothetical protein
MLRDDGRRLKLRFGVLTLLEDGKLTRRIEKI